MEASGRAPDAFGPFRVLHQIGAGALGPVFRAYEPDRDRLVAVKLYRIDLPPERVHQLVGEFERLIAAGLTHPALAAPVATGIQDNFAYLAQDYVAADSLDIVVRDYGPAPAADALKVATQLAGALDFAAVVSVTHGGLHPRDVLISTDDTRLTGLGVTRALEIAGAAAPVRRPYTAPERVAGARWDRRADVFSLAAVIHELLWGRRVAGTGADAVGGLTAIPGGDLDALRRVFARALAEDPAERFETALAFAGELSRAFPEVLPAAPATQMSGRKRTREPRAPITEEARLPLDAGDGAAAERPSLTLHEPDAPASGDVPTRPEPVMLVEEPLTPAEPAAPIAPLPEIPLRPVDDAPVDIDLRQAEAARFDDANEGVVVQPTLSPVAPAPTPPVGLAEPATAPFDSALERSRSAMWPLLLALVVGVALGFAGGYAVGARDHVVAVMSAPPPVATPAQAPLAAVRPDENAAAPSSPLPTEQAGTATPPAPSAAPTAPPRNEAATAVPGVGPVAIHSRPSGARVYVDGREAGVTPLTLHDLPTGSHRVRLVHEGYAPVERHVSVTKRRSAQTMTIALVRQRASEPARATAGAFVGDLTIESRPTGARAYLDGTLVGRTPLQLPQVKAGEHVIRLEHDGGYRRWSSSVRVVAGEKNRLTASLEK